MDYPDPSLPESMREALTALKKEYLSRWPEKNERLETLLAQITDQQGSGDALKDFRMEFHKLAGSGGSYGMPEITETSREAELYVVSIIEGDGANFQEVHQRIKKYCGRINTIFTAAIQEIDQEE
ncbi:MAG: hypothetical protein HOC91_18085 [Nitrospinaceae bacterium]|jgi:hypothetical protein|nr:hypothetical protein [Nitrospinaceae bacterium]MBT3435506.1 hypothetical protein [Nitrospinaceae bacterium]MBT3821077.1 hypothetical protein [Nitrospinaceae bacterium]MBT4095810.1 hypothetical protein [Nitrospinaceae bacterium]MBT4432424.1 hypothetical protein [Nitrospinaceae bacterium]